MAAQQETSRLTVVFWGTYDRSKPRTRNLLSGLHTRDWEIIECHTDVWAGVEDKTQIESAWVRLWYLLRWVFSYPLLIVRYLRMPKHDLVVVGYLGQVDILVLWPFARFRGVPIVWDALISLYNTVVNERAYCKKRHPLALLLYAVEWLGCRAADRILANTATATRYFVETFGIPESHAHSLFVGVETTAFPPRPPGWKPQGPIRVLFYGTLIPLHGVRYVLQAARLTQGEEIDWHLIGSGQDEVLVEDFLTRHPLKNLIWDRWVPYNDLAKHIHAADIGLGLFGESTQARWSVPNKVFQLLACGIPIITRDSPGARELLSDEMPGVYLVEEENPQAIVQAIYAYAAQRERLASRVLHRSLVHRFDYQALGEQFAAVAEGLLDAKSTRITNPKM